MLATPTTAGRVLSGVEALLSLSEDRTVPIGRAAVAEGTAAGSRFVHPDGSPAWKSGREHVSVADICLGRLYASEIKADSWLSDGRLDVKLGDA